MVIRKCLFIFLLTFQSLCATSLQEQFEHTGYLELCDHNNGKEDYDALYAYFDELIDFLQKNPSWAQKLYAAKERFIRSKERSYYSTDFFGFYNESPKNQIAFYYSPHFHEFITTNYPESKKIPQLRRFFEACFEIQKPYGTIFNAAAAELGLDTVFLSEWSRPPILFKVVKYLPKYSASKPHYDGTVLSLFLDSTDNQSLLLSPYKSSFTTEDFFSPVREFPRQGKQNSILLIPGTLLCEFSIYPTPHIIAESGAIRFAAIAFAMRPNYIHPKNKFSSLPNFKD